MTNLGFQKFLENCPLSLSLSLSLSHEKKKNRGTNSLRPRPQEMKGTLLYPAIIVPSNPNVSTQSGDSRNSKSGKMADFQNMKSDRQ